MSQLLTLGRVRLVTADGVESAAAPSKRIALLAYLAVASVRGAARRDALLALFWPELGDEEGRRALRKGLHQLRGTLGDDVFIGEGDGLQVRAESLGCDAVELERLLDEGQPEQALMLYHGDFLEGFHVDDVASEYEEWVQRTRSRLRRQAAAAAWTSAENAEREGEFDRAVALARRACEIVPDEEGAWRRLMLLHHRSGDRVGALRAYDELVARLAQEFDARPAPETTELAEIIRAASPSIDAAPPAADTALPIAAPSEAAAVPTAAPAHPRPRAPAHHRTLVLAGLAAALLLAIGATAYFATRDARAEPSLLAAGKLARKDQLLIADLEDLANDSTLAAAITEVLRVDLAQSPFVTVLTPRQVRTTLARMERGSDVAVDDSVAREVAVRMGAKAFVTGSVAKAAGAYTVTVRLVGTRAGEELAAYRETASDTTALIGAVDRVSERLRHRIGESLRDLRDMPPLTMETTASLAALRKLTEGQRLDLAGKRSEAIHRYEEAIAIDSAFAGAWLALAMSHEAVGNSGRSREAGRRALRHKDRLPFIDQSFVLASSAYARGDYDTAIEVYRRLLDRYPENYYALNNLALIYQDRRQFAIAESVFTVATRVDSTIANFFFGIQGNQLLQGKFADARRTLDLIARRFPDNPVLMNVEVQLASAQHRWDEAERHAETIVATVAGDTLSLVDPFEALALMATAHGRFAEADRLWRTHQRVSAASGSLGRHLFGVVRRAGIELRYRNRPARALAIVDSTLARRPLDSLLRGDRPYDELARFNAIAGRIDRARQLAAAADANDRALDRQQLAERGWTRGVIALAEGRAEEAEALLRASAEQHACTICALPDLARAYEAQGKSRAAAAVYERYVTTPWFWRYETDALELGPALERLAALYGAAGEHEKAAGVRAQLVQLWRRADAELQPAVARARAGAGPGTGARWRTP